MELDSYNKYSIMMYILRICTDKEHPLSAHEISDMICEITSQTDENGPGEKTVLRQLDNLVEAGKAFGESDSGKAAQVLYRVNGGMVEVIEGKPRKYYFVPILTADDVSMICSAVESNHYLSPEEKNYLSLREAYACSYKEGFSEFEHKPLPKAPRARNGNVLPSESSAVLRNIRIISQALRSGKQIMVTQGVYERKGNSFTFAPKKGADELVVKRILNPYAMLFQNGQLYIVVTHKGYTNPTHYRVDRIYEVSETNSKREAIPKDLKMYFNGRKFDRELYTSRYPLMAYNAGKGIGNYAFSCPEYVIHLAIDYFGTRRVGVKTDPDRPGNLIIDVSADFDNVRRFCCQHHQLVVPLIVQSNPDSEQLVRDVLEILKKSVANCEEVLPHMTI